jgi:chitinase
MGACCLIQYCTGFFEPLPSSTKSFTSRMTIFKSLFLFIAVCLAAVTTYGQNNFDVIAYFLGKPEQVDSCAAEKLTHILFSFCHLSGNKLSVDNKADSVTIQKLVALKKRNPKLKVMLSLGGWGGCKTCSEVFSSESGRREFAASVLAVNQYFHADGIDLDWEYPAIEGYPTHQFLPDDKRNFTLLIQLLRKTLGTKYEISFAAGGFQKYLDESIEWALVMKEVDRVNIMSYDLVNGYATVTGHHTPLYSTKEQLESTDNAVTFLIEKGIPPGKLVIGAAFYARIWEKVPETNEGLYQTGSFKTSVDYKNFDKLSAANGYVYHWDDAAKAPWLYNRTQKLFVTFDDVRSTELKTEYAIQKKLGGIMFWEISEDFKNNELLNVIDKTKKKSFKF